MRCEAAIRRMNAFGAMPTGAGGYPAGTMRAMLIKQCASSTTVKAGLGG